MIKTVIFDIGNVLTSFSWQKHFDSFGYPSDIVERLGKATVLSPQWCEYDLGNLPDDEILRLFIKNDPEIETELRHSLQDVRGILERCEYAIPWIKELKQKGYQVLFLSNFSEKVLKECPHVMDFLPYMDGGVFSFKVHMIKPETPIYEEILKQYHLIPGECVFIDDTLPNIITARNLGIHGIHFKDREQAIAELEQLGVK